MPLHANGRAIVCAGDVVGPHPCTDFITLARLERKRRGAEHIAEPGTVVGVVRFAPLRERDPAVRHVEGDRESARRPRFRCSLEMRARERSRLRRSEGASAARRSRGCRYRAGRRAPRIPGTGPPKPQPVSPCTFAGSLASAGCALANGCIRVSGTRSPASTADQLPRPSMRANHRAPLLASSGTVTPPGSGVYPSGATGAIGIELHLILHHRDGRYHVPGACPKSLNGRA